MSEPEAESVVYLKTMWKELKCFWSFPFGHRWEPNYRSKVCVRCGTWRYYH